MNLHEYQSKKLLKSYQIDIPNGQIISSQIPDSIKLHLKKNTAFVFKSQIHAGGRGKSGGVELINNLKDAEDFISNQLGSKLKTYQNLPHGQPVNKILVEEKIAIERELYFSILIDRQTESIIILCSTEGGTEIEDTAKKNENLIFKEYISVGEFPTEQQINNLSKKLKISIETYLEFKNFLQNAFKLFLEKDLSLMEVNPLIISKNNKIVALDCKISLDDNALFKHETLRDSFDWSQVDEKEAEAHRAGLNYIALEGTIGCMVNGAGLAMATMDLIKHSGGLPANFLDVGGGASAETVSKAFKILLSDKNVRVVLVNIFGGIMRCDLIADGIVSAIKDVGIKIPIVVRLEGTNVEIGKKILDQSKLNITSADSLSDAAKQAVLFSKA
ncbi:MAG: ADP-forming succinate--CoA ligase subunit beta [Nitrosomonadales bacterium]|jgi:succinyl-CoA synthetase beta subunit|nr:ADP-forming succinate--CoA ligase subunit beta [Nitrosomonadales bacterium]MBT4571264.1 ADP-forming succinate--CoA ligase subunit beta [Nitrosomonadales bacterium]MBT6251339.1 ADP-forming succinate--CoA ligase subunit beta [Nitrosomonadales bacterium]MBT6602810.1 ADP-forming succinate--CoA ligase subunit beta [Nitrosomonadales bacterium]MBT7690316.1 ADP-forming succinate--CoA ligase subunit beta [Nitrosomonadales bacterium]